MLPGPAQFCEREMNSMYISNIPRLNLSMMDNNGDCCPKLLDSAADRVGDLGGRCFLKEENMGGSSGDVGSLQITPTLRWITSGDIKVCRTEKTSSSAKDETMEELSGCQIQSNPVGLIDDEGESYGVRQAPHRSETPPRMPPLPGLNAETLAFCTKSRCPTLSRLKRHVEIHKMQ